MVLRSVSLTLLCLVASSAGAVCKSRSAKNNPLRIVGGAEVQPRQYPFQVSLQDGDFHFCGGSLISPGFVLTAAHCGDVEWVEVGAHSLSSDDDCVERIRVKRTIKHPNYNSNTMENDISILQLETDSGYDPITPYFHQTAGDDLEAVSTLATVSGWGTLSSGGSTPDVLHAVNVPIVSSQVCNQAYNGDIVDSMVCAGFSKGGKDSCQGDSGGPLFVPYGDGYVQLGVVSFGEGCALPDKYGVYTRLSSHADFLCSTAGVACRDGATATPAPSTPTPSPSSPTPKPTDSSSSNDGDIDNGSFDDINLTDSFDDTNFTDSFDDTNFTDSFDDNDIDYGSFDDTTFTNFTDSFDDNDIDYGSFDGINFTDSFDGNDIDYGSFDGTNFTDYGSFDGINFTDSFDFNDIDDGSFDGGFGSLYGGSHDGWDGNIGGHGGSSDGGWDGYDYLGDNGANPWSNWIWVIENGNFGDGGWNGNDDGYVGGDYVGGDYGDGGWNGNDGYVGDNYGDGGWNGNDYGYVGGDYGDGGWDSYGDGGWGGNYDGR